MPGSDKDKQRLTQYYILGKAPGEKGDKLELLTISLTANEAYDDMKSYEENGYTDLDIIMGKSVL